MSCQNPQTLTFFCVCVLCVSRAVDPHQCALSSMNTIFLKQRRLFLTQHALIYLFLVSAILDSLVLYCKDLNIKC